MSDQHTDYAAWMTTDDIGTLADEVELQKQALIQEEGSTLPAFLVDAQARLADMGPMELAAHMADVVIAVALRRPGWTPRRVMAEFAQNYKISDETWHESVRGEIVRALRGRGIELDLFKDRDGS